MWKPCGINVEKKQNRCKPVIAMGIAVFKGKCGNVEAKSACGDVEHVV